MAGKTLGKQNGHVVFVAIQYGRGCHVRYKRICKWPLESRDICHESIWRLTWYAIDAKYLVEF